MMIITQKYFFKFFRFGVTSSDGVKGAIRHLSTPLHVGLTY